jgi:parallel beta-helix repeat protein
VNERRRLRVAAAFVALVLLGMGSGSAAARGSALLAVDDDGAQCPDAQYATIQAAVDAAASGDKIQVCPGLYGPTDIPAGKEGLVLEGANPSYFPSSDPRCLRVSPPEDDRTTDSIVRGAAGEPGFDVHAGRAVIRAFTIRDSVGVPGVRLGGSTSRSDVQFSILKLNTVGIQVTSPGGLADSSLGWNCLLDNNLPGPASGHGIHVAGPATRVTVIWGYFRGNPQAAVAFSGAPGTQSRLSLVRNKTEGPGALRLVNVTDSTVEHNWTWTGKPSLVDLQGTRNVKVLENEIRGCGTTGITARGGTRNKIVKNLVLHCGVDGIALQGETRTTVSRNKTRDNGRDGVRLDSSSQDNSVRINRASGNGEHDCHDDSSGDRTAGTANVWAGNIGTTQRPPGICTAP